MIDCIVCFNTGYSKTIETKAGVDPCVVCLKSQLRLAEKALELCNEQANCLADKGKYYTVEYWLNKAKEEK